jgi:hypothetical protein
MPGLYDDAVVFERFQASVSAANLSQPLVAPCDLEVVGLVARLGTAPGGASTVTINVSNSPTSQLAGVSAYNLWTALNVPTITGTASTSFTTSAPTTQATGQPLIKNLPYALNYPFPGPSGTTGFVTAQSTSQTVETPVTAPPTLAKYQMSALVAPDNTYSDLNSIVTPANILHAGDIATFVVGGGIGSAANLALSLFCQRR